MNEYLIPEEREYRIYTSSQNGVPVIRDICGDERLALALAIVRKWFPQDTVFVREVIEIVREVTAPTNERPVPLIGETDIKEGWWPPNTE